MMCADADSYDSERNSSECYALAIRAAREKSVRAGQIQPRIGDEREQRWAREGTVPNSQLEAARNG